MNLFQTGCFTLNSKAQSDFKIECEALSDGDWACLAMLIAKMVGPFRSVEGVPRGGLKLAEYLQKAQAPEGLPRPHEFDSAWTCYYCGALAEKTRSTEPCPVRSAQALPHLIVDDVLTTGGSMERAKTAHWKGIGKRDEGIIGAVVFARGPCPDWIKPLFPLPRDLWIADARR